jgi:hypothetical protein
MGELVNAQQIMTPTAINLDRATVVPGREKRRLRMRDFFGKTFSGLDPRF